MILIILIISLVLRLINLNQSFWIDEIAQMGESLRPFGEQWQLPIDFHPPLYHYLVYFWLKIGQSEWWLRTTSVLSGVLTVYFSYLLVKKITNKRVAKLSALFLAISPFHIYYSQELRPYALATLLATLSMYLFAELLEVKKGWSWFFVLVNIFGLYSLYFFPFILVAQFFILLFLKREKLFAWLKQVGVSSLFFLPWLPFFFTQLRTGKEWTQISAVWAKMVSTPWPEALPLVFAKFSLGRISFSNQGFYRFLTLGIFLVFTYCWFKAFKKKRKATIFFSLYFSVPILTSFLIHIFLPIISPKRLLLVIPAFYTLLSLGVNSLSIKLKKLTIVLFILISAHGLFQQNTNPFFQREQWRQAVKFIEERTSPSGLVLFVMSPAQSGWDWYQEEEVETALLPPASEENYEERVAESVKDRSQVFVFQYLFELTDPEFSVLEVLRAQGFQRADFFEFPGVGLIYEYQQ